MKYKHKCICCGKKAEKKFRGKYFCNDCEREVRRSKTNIIWVEKHIFSIGNVKIYVDRPVKLK